MTFKKHLLPSLAILVLAIIMCFAQVSAAPASDDDGLILEEIMLVPETQAAPDDNAVIELVEEDGLSTLAAAETVAVGNENFEALRAAFPALWNEEAGVTQPVFTISATTAIHEEVWIEVPVESLATGQIGIDHSSKGQRDLICIRITRPRPTDPNYPHAADPANPTGVVKVPVHMVHSPYRSNNLPNIDYNRAIAENNSNSEYYDNPLTLNGITLSARRYDVNPDTSHYTYADVKSKRLKLHEWPWSDAAYPDDYYSIPASRGPKPISMASSFTSGAVASGGLSISTYMFARGHAIVYTSTPGNRYGLATNSATAGPFNDGLNAYGEAYEMLAGLAAIKWLNGECRGYKDKSATQEVVAYWANGDVSMSGTSYVGTTQMALASAGYEPLRAILPTAGLSSMYTYFRQNGAVYPGQSAQGEDAVWLSRYDMSRWQDPNFALGRPDRIAYDNIMARHSDEIERETGDYNQFWDMGNWYGQAGRYKAAVLFMQGLDDRNVGTQHMDQLYRSLKEIDPNYPIKLMIHLGAHTTLYNYGEGDFLGTTHKWLDRFVYGIENGIDTNGIEAWVADNVTGECHQYTTWPADGSELRRYYFGQTENGGGQFFVNPPPKIVEGPFYDQLKYRTRDSFRDATDPFYNLTVANYSDTGNTNWIYTPDGWIETAWESTMLFPSATPATPGSSTININPLEILSHTNARLAYVTEPLAKPVTLSGTARVTLDVTPSAGIGSLSAMIVDLGDARRGYQTSSTNPAWQIPAFTGAYTAYSRFQYTFSTAITRYKVVARNSVDIQNPNPSGVTYLDTNITRDSGFVPPYWFQTTEITPGKPYSYTFTLEPRHYTFREGNRLAVVIYSTDYRHTIRPFEATKIDLNLGAGSYIDLPLIDPLPAVNAPNYHVYMQQPAQTGHTVYADIMLQGTANYTQFNTAIAYDSDLLQFAGYENLSGLAAEIKAVAPNKISVRSVPSLNMLQGASCAAPVRVVTLKFTAKDNVAPGIYSSKLNFDAIAVTPTAGVANAKAAPGKALPITVYKPVAGAISKVNLITDQEVEIEFTNPVLTAEQAYATFDVLVDGKPAAYTFLSYFGKDVVDVPVVNIRLQEPLTIKTGPYAAYTLGPQAAASLSIQKKDAKQGVTAAWVPYYTFYDQLNAAGTGGQRSNRGSRGMMWVWGNENSRCAASTFANGAFDHIPSSYRTNYQGAAWVVATYVTAALDRTVGRSEQLVNAANVSGMHVVVVGNGDSVYTVPEFRQLYVSGVTTDWASRVTIGGSREIPIVVTTAEDVCRVKGANDNTFEMMREFARLFLELGVKDGWGNFQLGVYDHPDSYNSYKRLQENFEKSKAAGLWPGTNMLRSLEDYYILGTMIYFEGIPESTTWQAESFPINTRRELLEYDLGLYNSMAEIYGEWEYFVGGGTSSSDSSRRWGAPWYKHGQVENYTVVNGAIQPYEPLKVVEANLISPTQVELVFNREIKDLDELRTLANWEFTWTPAQTVVCYNGANPVTYTAGTTYTFNSTSSHRLVMEYYMWKTLTLKVTGAKFNTGYMSYEIGGFTTDEINKAFDDTLTVAQGYKPWFTEDAYYRDLNPVGRGFMGDIGDPSGWMADTGTSRTSYAVSQKVYDSQTPEQRTAKRLVVGKKIPRSDFYGKPSALNKGEYVRFDAAKGGFVAYDKQNSPLNGGAIHFPAAVNGTLNVTFKGSPAVGDWAGNKLEAKAYSVQMNPWQKQIMRSEKTGVYVYADAETQKNSLLVACDYWDYMFSNPIDNLGQRMADGFNFAYYHQNVKTGEFASGGLDILGYHNHMYMAPNRRSLYSAGPTVLYAEGLGYHVCSTMEYSLLRDYQYTRYKHESIMHHEGAHSVEYPAMFYFTDLNFELHEIWDNFGRTTWMGGSTYAGGSPAEWFATLSTYWFDTMRESVDGSVTGVWTAISTREELYEYDRKGYEFMKKVYYNGETYLDPAKVPGGQTKLPGWDAAGNSINDDIIKWGLSFPGTMNEDRADYGVTNQFRWTSWGAPNMWDINGAPGALNTLPGSGLKYVVGVPNPHYPGRDIYGINYNPYLLEYHYK